MWREISPVKQLCSIGNLAVPDANLPVKQCRCRRKKHFLQHVPCSKLKRGVKMHRCKALLVATILLCFVGFSVGQTPENDSQLPAGNGPPARSNHVVVVMEENRSINYALEYMPYL